METLGCTLSEVPLVLIYSPGKKLQATTLFSSFQIYLENSLLQRFLLFFNWPKLRHSEVLVFKTEQGPISHGPLTLQGELPSKQGGHTSPGGTPLSLCVQTSNQGVLPIILITGPFWTLGRYSILERKWL